MRIKQAVVLAGGEGKRLRPLTYSVPKPLVPVNGRPFLEYLVELFKENGITEVILLLGYLSEKFQEYFGDGRKWGIAIKYSVLDVARGSGARLKNACDLLDDVFVLTYADNYWPMDLARMIAFYKRSSVTALVTVYNNKDGAAEYGFKNNMRVADNGMVISYDRKRTEKGLNGVDIGFFILAKQLVTRLPNSRKLCLWDEVIPELIRQRQLVAYQTDHPYYTLTNHEKLSLMETFIKHKLVHYSVILSHCMI